METAFPAIWNLYFSDGKLTPSLEGQTVTIHVEGINFVHEYPEATVIGFAKRSLELLGCQNVSYKKIIGLDEGRGHYTYKLTFR